MHPQVHPKVTILVAKRQPHKRIAIHDRFSGGRANSRAHLIRNVDILVSGTRGSKLRAFAVQAVELVDDDRFEAVSDGINVREPFESADPRAA
jgi:hypothetical protein